MSLQGAVNPSNNAFSGGARFALGNPVGRSGTIAPASTGVSAPAAGVSGANINFARQNRGSNVRVPYARLVPVSDPSKGLPAGGDKSINHYNDLIRGNSTDTSMLVLESENLNTGRIAFIKGHRSEALKEEMQVKYFNLLDSNTTFMQSARGMGHGFNRFQQLCSIEYLARVYAVLFRRVKINLGRAFGGADPFAPPGTDKFETGILRDFKNVTGMSNSALAEVPDIAHKERDPKNPGEAPDFAEHKQGIFARDIHPFLRGKCLETYMVDIVKPGANAAVYRISRSTGDNFAFAALEHTMAKLGLTDWRPDGIVLSKDHAGPDEESDRSYDSRLGQLFNVVIQGPAVCTNFVGDFRLAPLVGDRVFVLVVCDVLFGKNEIDDDFPKMKAADAANDAPHSVLENASKEREAKLNTFDWNTWKTAAEKSFKAKDDDLLCNFRIRLSTSAEMINYSGVDLAAAKNGYKIPEDQRMRLKLGTDMGEYIVGGWCMGTVIDSAASRAALPGVFSAKSEVSSYALNIAVNVEWWSGDRLYRSYCDVEKRLLGRHNQKSDDPSYKLPWSDKAGARSDADFK